MSVAAPTGLSGVGFNALTIYPNATAVIKGGTHDARHIVAFGADIYAGAYGLFVDDDATATVCDAELIKGGNDFQQQGDQTYYLGKGAAYVASGATLNIAGGLFEGGTLIYNEDQPGPAEGPGIFASYQGPEATNLVITGGKILGGPVNRPSALGGMYRGPAIFMGGAGTVDVFGGQIGDEHTSNAASLEIGYNGLFGDTDGILNIYGGDWPTESQINVYGYDGAQAFVNIFGKDLQQTTTTDDKDEVEGRLCDGTYFHQEIFGDYTLTVTNDCTGYVARPSFPVCGKSGKSGKSSKSSKSSP